MSYFGFLLRFLLLPILLLGLLVWYDRRSGRDKTVFNQRWSIWLVVGLHVLIAVVYTTPWDNYLVATRVWWYDPALVTGFTLGWVPIEEYTFFVLQPILGGLWLWFLMGRGVVRPHLSAGESAGTKAETTGNPERLKTGLRFWSVIVVGGIWLVAVLLLLVGWAPGTYLALELGWALPPIMLQLAVGADILWRRRRLLLFTIVPLTLYLSLADALAIHWGTWTIDPAQSLNIYLGGVLPLEELIFFLLTNILVTFGIVLFLDVATEQRLAAIFKRLRPGKELVLNRIWLNADRAGSRK